MAYKLSKYQAEGFYLVSKLGADGLRQGGLAASQAINKGDVLVDDGNGWLTDGGADLAATFMGIAAESVTDATAVAGSTKIMYIPGTPDNRFSVPADTTVLAQTDVGELVDLGADSSHINPADNVTTGVAFIIEDIDISAEALAADAQGYAIGHFEMGRAAQT